MTPHRTLEDVCYDDGKARGFALIVVLVLLAALYAGATGVFVAARAELRAGSNLAWAEQAFQAAEGGLETWFAEPLQPGSVDYRIGLATVSVEARPLLTVDSLTVVYRIVADAVRQVPGGPPVTMVGRTVTMLGVRSGAGRVAPLPGTWRERFWR